MLENKAVNNQIVSTKGPTAGVGGPSNSGGGPPGSTEKGAQGSGNQARGSGPAPEECSPKRKRQNPLGDFKFKKIDEYF